jgi:hypothetical protein
MEYLIDQFANASPTVRIDPDASAVSIYPILDRLFEDQPVTITDSAVDQPDDIAVIRDGDIAASSSAEELLRSVLLVNSDVYITGSRKLTEVKLPDVLEALEGTPLRVRGYPVSDTEKLLLIAVSRAIERMAYETGAGTLRVGFQRFSRLVEESGTYRVYERLSETDVDIHAYGVEDRPLPSEFGFTVHGDTSRLHRRCWFAVFVPPSTEERSAGLFAIERDSNHYSGFWTFRPQRVRSINRAIERSVTA